MVWVKLDDHFDQNPKVAAVGPLGIALWVTGLAYCNRNLTDGFIPWTTARSLLAWEYLDMPEEDGRQKVQTIGVACGMAGVDVSSELVINLLLDHGLWELAEGGGYRIHDYDQFQPLRDQVEAERRNAAERTAKHRAKSHVSNGVANTVSSDAPVPDPVPDPDPEPDEAAAAARDEPFARTIRYWERGTGHLITPMNADKLGVWLEKAGEEWVRDAIEEMAASGAKSMRYLDAILSRWLLEGREEPSKDDPADAHDRRVAEFKRGLERVEAAKARLTNAP